MCMWSRSSGSLEWWYGQSQSVFWVFKLCDVFEIVKLVDKGKEERKDTYIYMGELVQWKKKKRKSAMGLSLIDAVFLNRDRNRLTNTLYYRRNHKRDRKSPQDPVYTKGNQNEETEVDAVQSGHGLRKKVCSPK